MTRGRIPVFRWLMAVLAGALAFMFLLVLAGCGPKEEPAEKGYYTGPFNRPGGKGGGEEGAPTGGQNAQKPAPKRGGN